MAITAEARRDLAERFAAVTPALVAEIKRGVFRAEESSGFVEGTHDVLRVEDGIGVVSVQGPLFKATGGITDDVLRFMGFTAYDDIWRALDYCQENGVLGVVLRMNSPGGDVGGCSELGDYVFSLRGKYPVRSYVETQCASAAAWIGTQSERIVSERTALTGWIGVIRGPMLDDSEHMKAHGFRWVELVSKHAKAKRSVPLDDEVLERMQVMCDDLGDCFEEAVARGRGVTAETVATDFGAGDGMIASKALAVGLIDEIGSFDSMLKAFRSDLETGREEVTRLSQPAAPMKAVLQSSMRARARQSVQPKGMKMANPNAKTRAKAGDPEEKDGTAKRAEADAKRAEAEEKREDAKRCESEADDLEKDGKKDEAEEKREDAKRAKADADDMESKADDLESEADEMDAKADGHQEPDGDEGKKALAALSGLRVSASISAHTAAIDAKMVPRAKLTALEASVNAIKAERAAEKKAKEDERLNAFADRAEERGYFAGLKGKELQAKRDRFIKIARNEPDAAEEILASLPAARIAGRVTAQGNPIGGHSARAKIDAFEPGDHRRVSHGDVDTIEKGSSDLMPKARAFAKEHKVSVEEAMVAVTKADPSLMA